MDRSVGQKTGHDIVSPAVFSGLSVLLSVSTLIRRGQTDRQTGRQADRQTDKRTVKHTNEQLRVSDRQSERQANR